MFNSDDLLQHIRHEITFGRPNEACELFLQLDHHLRNGGKPPSDWSEGPDDHPKPVKRLRKLLLAESTKLDELTADPHRKWDKDAVFRASIREQAFAEAIEELTSNQPAPVRRGVEGGAMSDLTPEEIGARTAARMKWLKEHLSPEEWAQAAVERVWALTKDCDDYDDADRVWLVAMRHALGAP